MRRRIKKSEAKALDKEFAEHIRNLEIESIAKAKRHKRNGCGHPLTAWMHGAPRNCYSKIFAVVNGESRVERPLTIGLLRIVDRIAKYRQLTDVQYWLLYEYVADTYRGGRTGAFYYPGPTPDFVLAIGRRRHVCTSVEISEKPLRLIMYLKSLFKRSPTIKALVSSKTTELILMKSLYIELGATA